MATVWAESLQGLAIADALAAARAHVVTSPWFPSIAEVIERGTEVWYARTVATDHGSSAIPLPPPDLLSRAQLARRLRWLREAWSRKGSVLRAWKAVEPDFDDRAEADWFPAEAAP